MSLRKQIAAKTYEVLRRRAPIHPDDSHARAEEIADALLPLLTREIAREREACIARGWDYMKTTKEPHAEGLQAAIRARREEAG